MAKKISHADTSIIKQKTIKKLILLLEISQSNFKIVNIINIIIPNIMLAPII